MKKVHSRKGPSSDHVPLITSVATIALVVVIAIAAVLGRQQASEGRDEARPAHHMASLGEINALLHKAQGEQAR